MRATLIRPSLLGSFPLKRGLSDANGFGGDYSRQAEGVLRRAGGEQGQRDHALARLVRGDRDRSGAACGRAR